MLSAGEPPGPCSEQVRGRLSAVINFYHISHPVNFYDTLQEEAASSREHRAAGGSQLQGRPPRAQESGWGPACELSPPHPCG